jgi:hypothetical protein
LSLSSCFHRVKNRLLRAQLFAEADPTRFSPIRVIK